MEPDTRVRDFNEGQPAHTQVQCSSLLGGLAGSSLPSPTAHLWAGRRTRQNCPVLICKWSTKMEWDATWRPRRKAWHRVSETFLPFGVVHMVPFTWNVIPSSLYLANSYLYLKLHLKHHFPRKACPDSLASRLAILLLPCTFLVTHLTTPPSLQSPVMLITILTNNYLHVFFNVFCPDWLQALQG